MNIQIKQNMLQETNLVADVQECSIPLHGLERHMNESGPHRSLKLPLGGEWQFSW